MVSRQLDAPGFPDAGRGFRPRRGVLPARGRCRRDAVYRFVRRNEFSGSAGITVRELEDVSLSQLQETWRGWLDALLTYAITG